MILGDLPKRRATSPLMIACGPSTSWSIALPRSCSSAAVLQTLTSAQFVSHCRGQDRDLDGVCQHVLSVAGAEVQASEQLQQFGLQAMHVGLHRGPFALLTNDLIDFLPRFCYDLLNARRMDASIKNEPR